MQTLNGHYLMRQQVPMVSLPLLVYLGAIAYISVEISLGSCWRRDILRFKGQVLFTNCNLICMTMCDMQLYKVTNYATESIDWCMAFTKTKVKVIICLFLLFSKLFFTTLTLQIFLCQHAPKRISARNASSSTLDKLKEVKTPWVLDGASSNYYSMIAYSQKLQFCD